jgi:A/G-specific adenine glycosylase
MFKELIIWSEKHFHTLPWRKNRSVYRTIVSEFMLQQTTVQTVVNHFERFIQEFPDLKSLSLASEEELLVAWKGLGYYRRAKNLKKLSESLVNLYGGNLPKNYDEWILLNGVGPYTASAILAIGMEQKYLAIDANIERVLARFFGISEKQGIKLHQKINENWKNIDESKLNFRKLNEALMDLGRTYCKKEVVECNNCKLKENCKAYFERAQLLYPLYNKEVSIKYDLDLLRVIIKNKNKVLAFKKNKSEWLSGQWEIPTFILNSTDKNLKQYPPIKLDLADERYEFIDVKDLNRSNLSTASIKSYKLIYNFVGS